MARKRPLKQTLIDLQKTGMTFTEIANALRISRDLVVNELYWERYPR